MSNPADRQVLRHGKLEYYRVLQRSCSNTSTQARGTDTHNHVVSPSPPVPKSPPIPPSSPPARRSSLRPSALIFFLEPWDRSLVLPAAPEQPPSSPKPWKPWAHGGHVPCQGPPCSGLDSETGMEGLALFLGATVCPPPTYKHKCAACAHLHCPPGATRVSSLLGTKTLHRTTSPSDLSGRPRKVTARFAAPPRGRCDRQAQVCVSASDAR